MGAVVGRVSRGDRALICWCVLVIADGSWGEPNADRGCFMGFVV